MNKTKQLEFCKKCENKKFDTKRGIICSLTNEKADFKDSCPNFKEIAEITEYKEYKRQAKKIRYPALELIINLFNVFGWVVGIMTIGIVMFTFTIKPIDIIFSSILFISGIFIAIINIALSEIIKVFIDIEENTRKNRN